MPTHAEQSPFRCPRCGGPYFGRILFRDGTSRIECHGWPDGTSTSNPHDIATDAWRAENARTRHWKPCGHKGPLEPR